MAVKPPKNQPKRTPLSRERVVRAAIALADERGGAGADDAQARASELGVEAMSLYNHVANKDDLLDGMIEIVFGEIDAPSPGGDWKAELRKRARLDARGAEPAQLGDRRDGGPRHPRAQQPARARRRARAACAAPASRSR